MIQFFDHTNFLEFRIANESVRIDPWGPDSLRIRSTKNAGFSDHERALLPPPESSIEIKLTDNTTTVINGKLKLEVDINGHLTFLNTKSGDVLLEEIPFHSLLSYPARDHKSLGTELIKCVCRFQAYEDEKIYGLGQHRHGFLDQKGCVLPLIQFNCEVNIPFALSSRGYGFLWNNPSVGQVEFASNGTIWSAEASREIDYWITTGDKPSEIIENYTLVTGRVPVLPEFASGFWQCKLRYKTQDELMSVAREYKERGLPLSVIVSDFFHWPHMGDWKFDPDEWPDPEKMTAELDEMGVKLMVSVWPTVSPNSENYVEMAEKGYLLQSERGKTIYNRFRRKLTGDHDYLHLYDPSNPDARQFVFDKCKENYLDKGVKIFWLDAIEPELYPYHPENMRFQQGPGLELANLYPFWQQMAFYEGMKDSGEDEIITLCRSAWAGSQRFGAAVWSGDIFSTFESLRQQVRAGLNIGLSGIPWWTTDIGGFLHGNPDDEKFRELFVRWFQYGTFCPLFRLHGVRNPFKDGSGAPNEVWSYGENVYNIVTKYMFIREKLRPYIMDQMKAAHECGIPVIRPLFFDFPSDETAWQVDNQYMFGPDILVAPILFEGAVSRDVYLPSGCDWTDVWSSETIEGGSKVTADAPIECIPLYIRHGSDVSLV